MELIVKQLIRWFTMRKCFMLCFEEIQQHMIFQHSFINSLNVKYTSSILLMFIHTWVVPSIMTLSAAAGHSAAPAAGFGVLVQVCLPSLYSQVIQDFFHKRFAPLTSTAAPQVQVWWWQQWLEGHSNAVMHVTQTASWIILTQGWINLNIVATLNHNHLLCGVWTQALLW